MGKVIVKSLRKTAKVTEDSHLDFRELIPLTDKSIFVDYKCNGCGICAKVCPAGNVKLIENEIKKIGLTRIQLFVQMSNKIARKMYYECGYKRLRVCYMNAFLQSDRIILRPFQKDDLPILLSYFNDAEIRGIIGEVFPSNEHSMELYLSKCQQANDRISFVIAMKKTHEIIGEAGLLRIFYPWRTADCSIIIFNKTYWNKGIGSEVANLLFDYAFNYLGLHRLSIGVAGINTRALAFWKKAGFIVEGKQTDGYFYKGKFSDFIMMYQLDHHFNSLKNQ